MTSLELNSYEEVFFGLYLIFHGLIHLVFLIHKFDKKSNSYVGWSGNSWLLDKITNQRITNITGKLIWIVIIIFFTLSGLATLNLIISSFKIVLIEIASVFATLAFIVFYDGLRPTPLHWILGVAVNVVLILFVVFWRSNMTLMIALLILIWLYGMLIHIKIIPKGENVELSD